MFTSAPQIFTCNSFNHQKKTDGAIGHQLFHVLCLLHYDEETTSFTSSDRTVPLLSFTLSLK
jgi:hypothetical protein